MNQQVEFFYSLIFSESLQSVATSQSHRSHTIVALRVTTHVTNKHEIGKSIENWTPPSFTVLHN